MTAALEEDEWSAARLGRTLFPAKTRYPFYRRLVGPQGRSGRAENLVPTEFPSRTLQLVAQSLYRLSYPAHKHKDIKPQNRNSIWAWVLLMLVGIDSVGIVENEELRRTLGQKITQAWQELQYQEFSKFYASLREMSEIAWRGET
jgi:hypothetical protein